MYNKVMNAIEKIYTLPMLVLIFALFGLSICIYIFKKKGKGDHLVCPIGNSCNFVLYSDYSKTFGIRNELGGILFYFLTAIIYFYILLEIPLAPIIIATYLFASLCAFMFSLYLIFVQAFIIKKWCAWCVTSAIISTTIFFISFLTFLK